MNDKFVMSARQAAELDHALERNGFTPAHVKKMSGGNILADFRRVLDGHATITVPEHLIDCDVDPFVPKGWAVVEHRKSGMFQWDPAKVKLWLAKGQRGGRTMRGDALRAELAKKEGVMNANVLDYLLANPRLIPEEWDVVFFWGTIYRDPGGRLYVRYLYRYVGGRHWHARWLGDLWDDRSPALLLAS